jgi:hypothetical protein
MMRKLRAANSVFQPRLHGVWVPAQGRDDFKKCCRLFVARRCYFAIQHWPAADSRPFAVGLVIRLSPESVSCSRMGMTL